MCATPAAAQPRGAIIWRAGDGPRPTPEHLTPKDAQEHLDAILSELAGDIEERDEASQLHTLFDATQGWVAERHRDKDLKRATLTGYEVMFERLYRDLGAQTPLQDFLTDACAGYFDDFPSYKVISEKTATRARTEGKNVEQIEVERWTAQPHRQYARRGRHQGRGRSLADELPGTWHHLRRGAYRVVPLNAQRAKSVTYAKAKELEADGWIVARRKRRLWMLVAPAAAQTRNEYRDIFSACLNYAVRQRWIPANPLVEVKRRSKREQRERVLRRDDFYDPSEIHQPAHTRSACLRGSVLAVRRPRRPSPPRRGPGPALGRRRLQRPYPTPLRQLGSRPARHSKTSDCEAIPMTPRLARALLKLKQRGTPPAMTTSCSSASWSPAGQFGTSPFAPRSSSPARRLD